MDYKLMCFPCLRKKKKLSSLASSSTELDDHFEYIVDKYTIRKVPLYTVPKSIDSVRENAEDHLVAKLNSPAADPLKEKKVGEIASIGIPPGEAYSVPRVTAVLPVTTHSSRSVKEKPRPADILDSTSPVSRRPVLKPNYVVIPSKASLHVKDIMITKREITNQYLNNFSSVFVDNLKDQVPKDPENLPSLSRPYTSALKNICVEGGIARPRKKGESCRSKVQKLVYSLPDGTVIETGYDMERDSNHANDDYQVLVHSSENHRDQRETTPVSFKSSLRGQSSFSENDEDWKRNPVCQPETTASAKQITYEDIQALDVGYEFPNSEKYGVKPKMTRIRFANLEPDRGRDYTYRTGCVHGIESDFPKKTDPFAIKSSKSHPQGGNPTGRNQNLRIPEPAGVNSLPAKDSVEDQNRCKRHPTEPSYLTGNQSLNPNGDSLKCEKPIYGSDNWESNYSKKKIEAGNFSFTELERIVKGENSSSNDLNDKLSERFRMLKIAKPCLKGVARPSSVSSDRSGTYTGSSFQQKTFMYTSGASCRSSVLCRSRSLESLTSVRKEDQFQLTPKTVPFLRFAEKREEEPETETSNSLYSRDSKTSSLLTSMVDSDQEVDKKATLRWKIIIKHHKDQPKENGMP